MAVNVTRAVLVEKGIGGEGFASYYSVGVTVLVSLSLSLALSLSLPLTDLALGILHFHNILDKISHNSARILWTFKIPMLKWQQKQIPSESL